MMMIWWHFLLNVSIFRAVLSLWFLLSYISEKEMLPNGNTNWFTFLSLPNFNSPKFEQGPVKANLWIFYWSLIYLQKKPRYVYPSFIHSITLFFHHREKGGCQISTHYMWEKITQTGLNGEVPERADFRRGTISVSRMVQFLPISSLNHPHHLGSSLRQVSLKVTAAALPVIISRP